MKTPSETRAGKLTWQAVVLKALRRCDECFEDNAGTDVGKDMLDVLVTLGLLTRRLAGKHGHMYTFTDAGHEALAASEPVEAVGEVYELPTGERRVQLFKESRDLPAGTKVFTHPAPEQPGKGEAERSVRFHNALWKSLPESVRSHASMLTQVWKTADSTELAEACKAGVLALAAVATPQPSDAQQASRALNPAEGDARVHVLSPDGKLCLLATYDQARLGYVTDHSFALSTPPTAALDPQVKR